MNKPIKTLFLDIGGVLLTNGWDHHARQRAAEKFDLDHSEMEIRHKMTFPIYEEGKLTLEEHLKLTVFYKKRKFTAEEFRDLIFAQSKSYPEMIGLIRGLKTKYGVKIIVVSNEARELNAYRIQKFKLNEFIDAFISSCFVGMRKPDAQIFRLALDIAQTDPEQILYLENTAMFVEIARGLGIQGIVHTDRDSTVVQLAAFGLQTDERDYL